VISIKLLAMLTHRANFKTVFGDCSSKVNIFVDLLIIWLFSTFQCNIKN